MPKIKIKMDIRDHVEFELDLNKAIKSAVRDEKVEIKRQLFSAQTIIDSGFPIDYVEENGNTMLSLAIASGFREMVSLLIYNGVNIDFEFKDLVSMLELAILTPNKDNEQIAIDLIKAGANLDKINPTTGQSVLHLASHKGAKKVVAALLNKGVDTSLKDKNGNTAEDSAKKAYEYEIALMLKNHRLDPEQLNTHMDSLAVNLDDVIDVFEVTCVGAD